MRYVASGQRIEDCSIPGVNDRFGWNACCYPIGTMTTSFHHPAHTYQRRAPEHHLLYRVLIDHLETFLQRMRTSEHALPFHVERELRSYLECGMLAHGFLRLRCPDCNESRTVAFSCKERGFCPSCIHSNA